MKKIIIPLILIILLLSGSVACPVYAILGVPCFACGMTRAYNLLLALKIEEAFLMHPLFWLPLVFLIPKARKKWFIICAVALLVAVWLLRMVLLFPHTAPMNFNYDSILGGFINEYR